MNRIVSGKLVFIDWEASGFSIDFLITSLFSSLILLRFCGITFDVIVSRPADTAIAGIRKVMWIIAGLTALADMAVCSLSVNSLFRVRAVAIVPDIGRVIVEIPGKIRVSKRTRVCGESSRISNNREALVICCISRSTVEAT
jgi:hypothetical protein